MARETASDSGSIEVTAKDITTVDAAADSEYDRKFELDTEVAADE